MADERAELLNSMLQRGPNKRRIKPAENNELLALALGVDDESEEDDEDFQFDSGEDDESFSGSGEEGDAVGKAGGNDKSQEQSSDSEDSDQDSDDSGPAISKPVTIEDMLKTLKTTSTISQVHVAKAAEVKSKCKDSLNLLICGICLGDSSDEDDEIVECDNCGICVHESCYGISTDDDSDADSTDTSDTESSTEPWFCDACKSGIIPRCELCPNLGGIFKETLRGQWVHLICALYTPGVTFDEPENLEHIVLVDLHPSKWGSRECELCEDVALCRTGVCIECDAGLCKTFFHVSCAQRKGLLSELPEEDDEDVADPLYAHCKLHLDKTIAKKKRQAYLTYVSRVKKFEQIVVDEQRKERVEETLQVAREVYKEQKSLRTLPPPPKERVPRSILSSSEVLRHLLKKAELLGIVTQQSKIANTYANVRRKWHVPTSLTVEFVNYFYDRGNRMEAMKSKFEELTTNNKDLQQEEQTLRNKYEELSQTTKLVTSQFETMKNQCFQLHNMLCRLAEKEFPLPDYLEGIKRRAKKEIGKSDELKLSVCSKCEKTENQHLMVDCDTCRRFYHLACVDPPLTRMPKKSKKLLWQCTECDSSSSEEEDVKMDANDKSTLLESRQKRNIKEPTKFTPVRDPKKGKRKRTKQPQSANPPKVKKVVTPRERKQRAVAAHKKRPSDVRSNCSTCGEVGDNSNLVRCDECKLCFHFTCLNPPTKSNPKPKGYSWYCTECDDTPDEDSEEEMAEEKTEEKAEEKAEETTETTTTTTMVVDIAEATEGKGEEPTIGQTEEKSEAPASTEHTEGTSAEPVPDVMEVA